jgi:hypothetical protein
MSTFNDGLFQYGGQPVGAMFASPWSTVRFVDYDNGKNTWDGKSPSRAKSTIQSAVTASGRGDVIYVRPRAYVVGTGFSRYTEEVTTVLTQSDLSIIGTVNTPNPEFGVRWKHATNTTGYCLVNIAPALHLENIGFFAESAAGAMSILHNGATNTQRGSDGMTIVNCVIKGKGIVVASGGDGFTVQNTRFHCGYGGAVADINYSCSANPGRRLLIRNCEWQDGNGTTSSGPCITIAAPLTELLIRDCYFGQLPTGSVYIATSGANYGLIANCFFNIDDLDTDSEISLGTGVTAVGCFDKAGIATTA